MPPTTQRQLRAIACSQLDDLQAQLESLWVVVNSSRPITKSEILKLLRNTIVIVNEARALLRVTSRDINKEMANVK